jgi:hypothetical protein
VAKKQPHLYRFGSQRKELMKFEDAYGKEHGRYVYGATVGKIARERLRKRGR